MKSISEPNECQIPFERMSKFIRQFSHDVRNGLSAIDLEAAFIAEIVKDPEACEEVGRLRNMVSSAARMLREMSQNFQPATVHTIPWQARTVFEELESRVLHEFREEAANVERHFKIGDETLEIDLEQTIQATFRVLLNAFQFRKDEAPVRLSAFHEPTDACGQYVIEIREPKSTLNSQVPPEQWGREPLVTTRLGGYGLGLYRARSILEAQGGALEIAHIDKVLVSRLVLPCCGA